MNKYTVAELLETLIDYVEADMADSFHIENDCQDILDSCNAYLEDYHNDDQY